MCSLRRWVTECRPRSLYALYSDIPSSIWKYYIVLCKNCNQSFFLVFLYNNVATLMDSNVHDQMGERGGEGLLYIVSSLFNALSGSTYIKSLTFGELQVHVQFKAYNLVPLHLIMLMRTCTIFYIHFIITKNVFLYVL